MIEENREVHNRRVRGRVYFIRAGNHVKIGFSARPLDRLYALQVSHPETLEIVCTIAGDLEAERKMHARFKRYRVRGEWFRIDGDLARYVDRMAHPRQVLPEVSRLLKLRRKHGADTAIGHHISVLTEALPIHRAATSPDQKRNLAASIARTSEALAGLLKAAA